MLGTACYHIISLVRIRYSRVITMQPVTHDNQYPRGKVEGVGWPAYRSYGGNKETYM